MPTTRFAPSPTGNLHLGHAFSALYAHQKAEGGLFLLRIEDIDPTRCRREFVEAIYGDLAWLGLEWETPVRVQSDHFDEYQRALTRLQETGFLYPCFCTRKDIQREMSGVLSAPHGSEGAIYPGTCRRLSQSEREEKIATGTPYSLRLDVAKSVEQVGAYSWTDEVKGRQSGRPDALGDVILARKDTPASYHLCVTVDDAIQNVEVVTRGEDLFRATDVHRLLQELLGLPEPRYSHHRLVLDPSGAKFSKRDGSVTLRSLRERGETLDTVRARLEALGRQ